VGAKNAKNGSEAEPKEVEHGGEVIADQILMLLISKADGIVTRHTSAAQLENAHRGLEPSPLALTNPLPEDAPRNLRLMFSSAAETKETFPRLRIEKTDVERTAECIT
jgi:hypothetical protein